MSSRALRKLQREKERLALEEEKSDADQQLAEESGEDDEDEEYASIQSKPSAFEMLGQLREGLEEENEAEENNSNSDNDDDDDDNDNNNGTLDHGQRDVDQEPTTDSISAKPSETKKQNARRNRKKRKNKATEDSTSITGDEALSEKEFDADWSHAQEMTAQVCRLLAVNKTHLLVHNEMKRLFGRVVYEVDREEQAAREQNLNSRIVSGQGFGLAEIITGKLSVAGPGLASVLRRRNIFAQGREDWPRQTNNGMSMEIQSTSSVGAVRYEFVWNERFNATQNEFYERAETMDPVNLLDLIRKEPYHVSTLLQLSEVAKQEKDRATTGELLERALFAFGKALHPTFEANLVQGKARLDFSKMPNREFFLTVWKWISNISQRATYRTAFEWAKLLLSLDPAGDPYCVCLVIDQLALRSRQDQALLDIASSGFFAPRWSRLPNIQYSLGLAQRMLDGKTSEKAIERLSNAIKKWPWIAKRLFQSLGIDKIPRSVWGATPPVTEKDKLYSELYLEFALDVWKLPEAKEFLVDTATKLFITPIDLFEDTEAITRDEARLVLLTENPPLIGLLPRSITSTLASMLDPLPPWNPLIQYDVLSPEPELGSLVWEDPDEFITQFLDAYDEAESVMPGLQEAAERLNGPDPPPVQRRNPDSPAQLTFTDLLYSMSRNGTDSPDFGKVVGFLDYFGILLNHPRREIVGSGGGFLVIGENLVPHGRRPSSTNADVNATET